MQLKPETYWKICFAALLLLFVYSFYGSTVMAVYYNAMPYYYFYSIFSIAYAILANLVLLSALFLFFLKKKIGFYLALAYGILFEIIIPLVFWIQILAESIMIMSLTGIIGAFLGYGSSLILPFAFGIIIAFLAWKSRKVFENAKEPETKTYWKICMLLLGLFFIGNIVALAADLINYTYLDSLILSAAGFIVSLLALILFFIKNKIGYYLALAFSIVFPIILTITFWILPLFVSWQEQVGLGSLGIDFVRIAIAIILILCIVKSKPLFEK
ncbi:MAG TPA: hypothetical protein VI977_01540 [archaeon]|nr:hypothetical protein [archaeon]